MVKLVSSRSERLYAPGGYRDLLEGVCSAVYILGAVLILVGLVFQLPKFDSKLGLLLALLGAVLVFLANLHDLYAHLAGIDFRMDLLSMDPQYVLIELAVPLVSAIGSFLIFLGALFLLLTARGRYSMHTKNKLAIHGMRLLIAGPALWLLAAVHNAFQVYQRAGLAIQAFERAVSICFIIGSTLLICGGVLGIPHWTYHIASNIQLLATWMAIIGSALLVLGGILNALRVGYLQRLEGDNGYSASEPLRGGAHEALRRSRGDASEPFVEGSAKHREDVEAEGGNRPLYKDVVASQPERLY